MTGQPAVLHVLLAAPPWLRHGGPAALGGRFLLLATVAIVVVSQPFLGLPSRTTAVQLAVCAATAVLVAVSRLVPWGSAGRWTPALFPLSQLVLVSVLGLTSGRSQIAYVGLLVLSFVYAGLFLPLRAGLLLVPLAWGAYCTLVPRVDTVVLVRLAINGAAWVTIVYALAVATAHQRSVAEQLELAARTDALTGLANRRGLEERLTELGDDDCLAVCDLDHFKRVNDVDGHAAGDAMLARFAATIRGALGAGGHAARYGGEEFVLVFQRTSLQASLAVLEAMRATWREHGTGVTFSAGLASARGALEPHHVLAAADTALYAAKAAGRDQVVLAVADPPGRPRVDG